MKAAAMSPSLSFCFCRAGAELSPCTGQAGTYPSYISAYRSVERPWAPSQHHNKNGLAHTWGDYPRPTWRTGDPVPTNEQQSTISEFLEARGRRIMTAW